MAGSTEPTNIFTAGSQKAFTSQLKKVYTWYTGGFVFFIIALAILEQPWGWTVLLVAGLGLVGGLVLSQMLTLFTTPVIYLAFADLSERVSRRVGPAHEGSA